MVLESDLEEVERLIGEASFSQMVGQVGSAIHDRASDGTLKRISIEISVSAGTRVSGGQNCATKMASCWKKFELDFGQNLPPWPSITRMPRKE
jgi:hypothetical protein